MSRCPCNAQVTYTAGSEAQCVDGEIAVLARALSVEEAAQLAAAEATDESADDIATLASQGALKSPDDFKATAANSSEKWQAAAEDSASEGGSTVFAIDPVPGSRRPARRALAHRRPLPAAHTASSLQKRRPPVNLPSQSSLSHLRPLPSLVATESSAVPTQDVIHIAVSGAAMTQQQLQAVATGAAPAPFAGQSVDTDAVWVPPMAGPVAETLAKHLQPGVQACLRTT